MLPQQAIADQLGISRSAVAGHIMNLTRKGLIKGRGYVLSDAPFVTVIGGANIDIHGKSAAALRQHDSNPGKVHISAGGVARNIADNLARLGVDSRLITAVGNDQHGQVLMQLSRNAGINMQYVHRIANAPTSTYLAVLDEQGDMQVAINDMNIIEQLNVAMLAAHEAMLAQSAIIIVDCNLPADTLAWIGRHAAAIPLFADTVSAAKAPRLQALLPSLHTLKTTASEIAALTGRAARTQPQLRSVATELHARGLKRLFVTRGEDGVFFSDGAQQGVRKPALRRRAVPSTGGAGDAFLAGLAYSWLGNWTLARSLQFALAAADLTLSHPGSNSPALSVDTISKVMEQQGAG